MLAVAVMAGLAMPPAARVASATPAPGPARQLAEALVGADADVATFYARRGYAPLWLDRGRLRPEAEVALRLLTEADRDNLDPKSYRVAEVRRALADAHRSPLAAMRAEALLSASVAAFSEDLHRSRADLVPIYADPAVAPPRDARARALVELAAAPSLGEGLRRITQVHPIYAGLREALAKADDARTRSLLRLNLERARALPADSRKRLIVDIAAGRLELWEGGRVVDSMPVVVGRVSHPTPVLAGMVRFAVLNPYWHMPPDLAAERIAPAVLRTGPSVLQARRLDVVSEFSTRAALRDPAEVDWAAVARGDEVVHLRERPGPGNMMGRVKFIFPNRLGVYLHDTPERADFARPGRAASAGCVRVSDAARLAGWIMARPDLAGSGAPEERVDLPEPVPIYLTYLTARTQAGVIEERPDIYGWDARRGSPDQAQTPPPTRPQVKATR